MTSELRENFSKAPHEEENPRSVTREAHEFLADLLVVALEDQRVAMLGSFVREVVQAVAMVAIPDASGVIEGIIDLRGAPVPVVDLRRAHGLPPRALSSSDHLVILSVDDRLLALRVDRALRWMSLPEARIGSVETLAGGPLAGLARTEDGLTIIVDPRRFLAEAERVLARDAARGAAS